jgi:hypothetical protein
MADMQSPAAGDGRARECSSQAPRDGSQLTIAGDNSQYELLARVRKNAREEFRVARRRFKNFHGVELRVFKLNGEGSFIETSRSVALRLSALPDIIKALTAAVEVIS